MSSSAASSDVTSSNAAAGPAEGTSPSPAVGPAGKPGAETQVWLALRKTLRHFFPNFVSWLASTPDPRDPRFTVYPMANVLMSGLLLFLTKLGSRRQMRFQFGTSPFIANLNAFVGTSCEAMLHPDTLAYLAKRLPLEGLEDLRHAMLNELLRKKVIGKHRLLDKDYLVAIDGTGFLVYRERHCEHCLTRDHGGTVVYYHPVLEAKLVTRSGLCLSIATEFMEHAYSEHEHAAKNFYLLLQIAPLIAQLLEKGLLAKSMAKKIGAIRNVARFLLEELRRLTCDARQLDSVLAERIQIRLGDS